MMVIIWSKIWVWVAMGLVIGFIVYLATASLLPLVFPELEQEGGENNVYMYKDPNNPDIIMFYDEPIETFPNGTIKNDYFAKIIKGDNNKDKEDKDDDDND